MNSHHRVKTSSMMSSSSDNLEDNDRSVDGPSLFRYHAYDVAIDLNNAGVTLLQNSCYSLAASSFRESLHAMKLAMDDSNQNRDDDAAVTSELSNMMTASSKRFLDFSESNDHPTTQPHDVAILCYDGTMASVSRAAAMDADVAEPVVPSDSSRSAMPRFAIKIVEHRLRARSCEIDLAIVLYNYATLFDAIASSPSLLAEANHHQVAGLMANSKRLYLLSYDVLYQLLLSIKQDHHHRDNSNDAYHHNVFIVASMLSVVVVALFRNALDSRATDDAFRYSLCLHRLRLQYGITMMMEHLSEALHAAAAA